MNGYDITISEDRVGENFGKQLSRGTIVYIEGKDGSGKSVLSQRFAYGALKSGHTVTYSSPEFRTHELINQMESLSYGIRRYLLENSLLSFPISNTVNNAVDVLQESKTYWTTDIVVFDGFGTMAAETTDREMKQFYSFLRKQANKGKTIIITAEADSAGATMAPFRRNAGVYISLNTEKVGDSVYRTAQINRFTRQSEYVDNTVSYSVQQGIGLSIETQSIS